MSDRACEATRQSVSATTTRKSAPPGSSLTFLRSSIDGLDDVDHFLFVIEVPVDFVVVTGSQIDHDVLHRQSQSHTNKHNA